VDDKLPDDLSRGTAGVLFVLAEAFTRTGAALRAGTLARAGAFLLTTFFGLAFAFALAFDFALAFVPVAFFGLRAALRGDMAQV
jgi:hypothetical protein